MLTDYKKRLQSKTVRAVIAAAIVSVVNAYIALSGNHVDVENVKLYSDIGLQLAGEGFTLALLWQAYKGRVTANTKILPWKKGK